MKIRLMLVIPTMDRGGAEKQLTLLATGLPRDRFEVTVVLLTRGGPLESVLNKADIPVLHCDKKWKLDPFAYQRLKGMIRQADPHIVHTWIFAANCYGRAAAWQLGVPVILGGERCVDLWKRNYEFAIDRQLAKRSAGIITNSQGVVDFYSRHRIPASKFIVIPNGIRARAFEAALIRAQLLKRLGLPDSARLIGAVGRLWPQKRLKDAIWATELLSCVRDDTHLLVVGDGPQRWRLERYTEQVRVQDHVHFLGQIDEAPQLISALDQFWITSGYEGQSNALMEAMIQGVPVVASEIPGNCDLVKHEETGLLFQLGDRADLAKQSERLTNDPEFARQLADTAQQKLKTEFSVEKMVERHAQLYERLWAESSHAS